MNKYIRDNAAALLFGLIGSIVMALAFGGWSAHAFIQTLATKEDVQIAWGKADYLIERREEALVREISELERRRDLTQTQRNHLRSLRQQLDEVRRVRKGK